MLEAAGHQVIVMAPDVDDGLLRPGRVAPEQWVAALAYLKARRVWEQLRQHSPAGDNLLVLGADTVCVLDGMIVGQPRDAADARRMLGELRDRAHQTMTGVCLMQSRLSPSFRQSIVDAAEVTVGAISDQQIEEYLATNQWVGKAGAYNLSERIADGWPIQCIGDPATVMGLPMRRLAEFLNWPTPAGSK